MVKLFFISLFLTVNLFAMEELQSCAKTEVSKTSVILTCMHGEYYVKFESSSKRDVEELRVLYTKADKYKYLKEFKYKK